MNERNNILTLKRIEMKRKRKTRKTEEQNEQNATNWKLQLLIVVLVAEMIR